MLLVALILLAGCHDADDGASDAGPLGAERDPCGNGRVDANESCDSAIPPGMYGSCPTECVSEDPCKQRILMGSGCEVSCAGVQITRAVNDDGCCPAGVGAADDSDCGSCGDGILGPSETCDPPSRCPTRESCTATSACVKATFSGAAESCNAKCQLEQIERCEDADACCPAACQAATDSDCPAK